MLTRTDLEAIRGIMKELKVEIITEVDTLVDRKLKKSLQGVARKKDLYLLEKRMIRRLNILGNYFDSELVSIKNRFVQ